jgi:hypothetical protein
MFARYIFCLVSLMTLEACNVTNEGSGRSEKYRYQDTLKSETDSLTYYLANPEPIQLKTDSISNKAKKQKRRQLKENEFYLGPVPQ